MCFGRPPSPPPPPPLAPPPPPPEPPQAPLPSPEPLESEVNPQVRRAKSKKVQNQAAQGTNQLRIPLNPKVNAPTSGPQGGLNQ